ncbi:MAG: hypothetical protein JWP38_1093, partial [Herbaspirillum sp.]|nr:hypothetical protein [Herbaspirillum sp.]
AGEDADIPFQIANIGNGVDDVSVTVKNFPLGVDEVTIYSADAGGVAKPSTGVRTSKYHQNEFVLKGIKPGADKPRYIVLRMPLPATSSIGDEFKIDLVARMKNGESKSFGAAAVVSDKTAFSVTPGRSATLYEDKKTMVSFWVKGGPNATRGYFQIWAVKSSDLSTPLSYEVGKKVYFGSETLNRDEIDDSEDKLFKIARPVGANRRYMIKLPITIPDAMRGDDILMFVKYGEAEEYGVKPLAQEGDLARSAGLVVRFNHKAVSPKLEVTGNSAGGAGPDFSVVEHAVSGDTVDYALTLYNNSTFPDSFVLEEQTGGKGALIAKVTPMDIDGMQPIAVGASGLPEVGPIEANGKREFKIRIRLRDGRVSRRRQGVQFRFRAVRATGVDEIAKAFSISEVVPGSEPVVQFLSESGATSPIDHLALANGEESARFYMRIGNADTTSDVTRQYRMQFVDDGFTIKSYSDGMCGAAVTSTGTVDKDGKIFCVDADLNGKSRLQPSLALPDMKSGDSQDIFVKVSVPKEATVDRAWSLTLGLRKPDGTDSLATTVLTLALDDSGLVIIKEVAVIKSDPYSDCLSSDVPERFAKTTDVEVQSGDCIWYRISVSNPQAATPIRKVSIHDPIPAYSTYIEGTASVNLKKAIPGLNGNEIVTEGIDLESDQSLVLTYPVVVRFDK